MSAFYDIWISNSNAKPKHTRLDNADWKADKNMPATWLSLPDNDIYVQSYKNDIASIKVIGSFYDDTDIKTLLDNCVHYINNKQKFEEPAGHYILFVYLNAQRMYHVFTNRLGTYHAYWSSIDGVNTISTYYTGLAKAAITKTLDWEGITGFMAMGFFPANTTYLEGISVLEPASHYMFDERLDMISHTRYWNWEYNPVDRDEKNLLEEFGVLLTNIFTSTTKEKRVALPISGGLDSRTLAGVLAKNNISSSIWAYSYGFDKQSQEIKIASKIAAAEKFNFGSYIVPQYLFNEADVISDSVELFQYIDGTRQACMLQALTEHADVVIGGHWGDVWMDDMGMNEMNELTFFKKKILKNGSDWLLHVVCKPHYPKYDTFLQNYFNNWVHKYRHIQDADFRMKIFKTDQWSFRWTLPSIRMYQAAVMPVLPFYDKRIVDFFCKVPMHLLSTRRFQVEYIKAYHPKLAAIKWQEYDSNLYNYQQFNNRNIGYRAIKKVQSILKSKKPVTRNWELFYLNENGRKGLEEILFHNKPLLDVVPENLIREMLNDLYDYPNAANGYKVSMMHTFARFLKNVFED
ncbi:hypothetical protein CAP35_03700 [Chitinophagaceae bacterium IBVUCB1]|nr:hypothetical protein CAP35_03700 [Chitinophagaceae bacterium IBVUCB1]